jgi:hypothetical protein
VRELFYVVLVVMVATLRSVSLGNANPNTRQTKRNARRGTQVSTTWQWAIHWTKGEAKGRRAPVVRVLLVSDWNLSITFNSSVLQRLRGTGCWPAVTVDQRTTKRFPFWPPPIDLVIGVSNARSPTARDWAHGSFDKKRDQLGGVYCFDLVDCRSNPQIVCVSR